MAFAFNDAKLKKDVYPLMPVRINQSNKKAGKKSFLFSGFDW